MSLNRLSGPLLSPPKVQRRGSVLDYLGEYFDGDIVDRLEPRVEMTDDIFHPLVVCGAERRVPVVEHGELDGNDVADSALDAFAALSNLFAEIERPCRVRARRIENCSDVVTQNYGRKETNVDIASNLEYVLVLPARTCESGMH